MPENRAKSTNEVMYTRDLLRSIGAEAVPITPGEKGTFIKSYTDEGYKTDWDQWINANLSIGAVLGSGPGLIDIDLDCGPAWRLATKYLPQTPWTFGRKSKINSHFVYTANTVAQEQQVALSPIDIEQNPLKTSKFSFPKEAKKSTPTIIELRAAGSQTVMPGSVHASGEPVVWTYGPPSGPPPAKDPADLRRACKLIAMTVIVAEMAWQDGYRHDVALCLSGMMHGAGFALEDALLFFRRLIEFAGGESKNVLQACSDTYKRAKADQRIAGAPRLAEVLESEAVGRCFRRWFGNPIQEAYDDFDARFVALLHFGKFSVGVRERIDDLTRPDFRVLSLADFEAYTRNQVVHVPDPTPKRPDNTKRIKKSDIWLNAPGRVTFEDSAFLPGEPPESGRVFNLWRGWAAKPDAAASCRHWLYHLYEYIAAGDRGAYDWILDWMADLVQNPAQKPGTALIMLSGQRSGKNSLVTMLSRMIGLRYYHEMSQTRQITTQFNSFLQQCLLLFANEAMMAGDPRSAPVLRALVADPIFHLDHKHAHAQTATNATRVIMASNNAHVIDRALDDARYTVLEVKNPRKTLDAKAYRLHFDNLWAEINGNGADALLHFLMGRTYEPWTVRSCYETAAGESQTLASIHPVLVWWKRCLDGGQIVLDDVERVLTDMGLEQGGTWPVWISKAALADSFAEWGRSSGRRVSEAEFWLHWYDLMRPVIEERRMNVKQAGRNQRRNVIMLPTLETAARWTGSKYPLLVRKEKKPVAPEGFEGAMPSHEGEDWTGPGSDQDDF